MELGAKFNRTWYMIQWSLLQDLMELAAKSNGAGCDVQWSRVRCSMEQGAIHTYVQADAYVCVG